MYATVVISITNAAAMLATKMTATWPEVFALRNCSEENSGAVDVEPTVRQPAFHASSESGSSPPFGSSVVVVELDAAGGRHRTVPVKHV